MDLKFAYGICLLIIALLIICLGVYISFNEKKQQKWLFRGLFLSCFLYTFTQGIVYVSSNEILNFYLLCSQLVLYPLIYTLWIIFIANYTEYYTIKKVKYIILCLFLLPIILFIELIYVVVCPFSSSYAFIQSILPYLSNTIHIYTLVLSFSSLILIYLFSKKKGSRYRDILITLAVIPFLPLFTSLIRNLLLFEIFNFTPIMLCIIFLVCLYLIYVSRITEIMPYSENEFIENVDLGILGVDNSNTIIKYNKTLENYLNISSLKIGNKLNDLLEDIKISGNIKNFLFENKKYGEILDNNGRWIEITRNKVENEDDFSGTIYTFYDITKLKETEQKALDSQKITKDKISSISEANNNIAVLLAEVNHRVKNNLQLILSFIYLDQKYNTNPTEILNNAIKRVSSMSLVYDNTFDENQLAAINIDDFIHHTVDSFMGLYSDGTVDIKYDIDKSIRLPLDIVTPLSLIINELLTNCFKHGFKDYNIENKNIYIKFKNSGDNHAYLIIEDNGKGLNKDIDIEKSGSLGLTIIKSLTKQIKGKFSIVEADGAAFKIEFPLEK